MSLEKMFETQAQFQLSLGLDMQAAERQDRVQLVKDNVLAATDELHEVLAETSWKPWAKNEKFNTEAIQHELVDVFCFFLNLCLVSGMTADTLATLYGEKMVVNWARQANGYMDRLKCPTCDLEIGTCDHG